LGVTKDPEPAPAPTPEPASGEENGDEKRSFFGG
jgi:hypothetical protein